MNKIEVFSWLFVDSFASTLILPAHFRMALDLMLHFGEYNKFLMFITATFGSILGGSANYLFGKMLISVTKYMDSQTDVIDMNTKYSHRIKSIALIILTTLGFKYFPGSALQVLTGYLRIKFVLFTFCVGLSYATHYAFLITRS